MKYESKIRGGAAAVLALVLLAGAALGVAIDRTVFSTNAVSNGEQALREVQPSEPPNEWAIDRLDLTDSQLAAIDSVVAHYGVQMSVFQKEFRPRYRAIMDSTTHALKAVLTPEQQIRYDSLEARSRRWRERTRAEAVAQ